jgi:hypothetical protein
MDRSLFSELTAMALARTSAMGFSMPQLRFFTPLQSFWDTLKTITAGGAGVIEVGAGNGDMYFDGMAHGFAIQGIDTMQRDGVSHVYIADATTFPFKPGMLVICCRPDHSGWAGHALEQALECGASFAYIGLRQNFYRDLSDERLDDIPYESAFDVGEEGEVMLGWGPLFTNGAN